MASFTLYNDRDTLAITRHQAHKLELALNKSAHAQLWRYLGDVLYDWHCGHHERPDQIYTHTAQMQWARATLG